MKTIFSYGILKEGLLVRRYKRFLADVCLEGGGVARAFCPNSGSMMGLSEPGNQVLLSPAADPKRSTRWTLEAVRTGRTWVGVNTHLTNSLARTIIESGLLEGLSGYRVGRAEVRVGSSRLDFLLNEPRRGQLYLEVKSVTLRVGDEARFPDAVTTRGARHLRELGDIVKGGQGGGAMLYVVQRGDCACFAPASEIDPAYALELGRAQGEGVAVHVAELSVRRDGIYLKGPMQMCAG